MKVVFDTNVLVSALVFPGGRGEEALLKDVADNRILECALAGRAQAWRTSSDRKSGSDPDFLIAAGRTPWE